MTPHERNKYLREEIWLNVFCIAFLIVNVIAIPLMCYHDIHEVDIPTFCLAFILEGYFIWCITVLVKDTKELSQQL